MTTSKDSEKRSNETLSNKAPGNKALSNEVLSNKAISNKALSNEALSLWRKIGYGMGDIYGGGTATMLSFFYLLLNLE